jgi:hypothetical protein
MKEAKMERMEMQKQIDELKAAAAAADKNVRANSNRHDGKLVELAKKVIEALYHRVGIWGEPRSS